MFLHIFPITDYCFNLFVIMNFLSNNKWPQEGISYTFQIPPNISIERGKNNKMNWILVYFYHTRYAGRWRHRQNSVTIKNIIFSKIFYCLEIVSRFIQTIQSSQEDGSLSDPNNYPEYFSTNKIQHCLWKSQSHTETITQYFPSEDSSSYDWAIIAAS